MPLTQNQIAQAMAGRDLIEAQIGELCEARDVLVPLIGYSEITDESTGIEWLLRAKGIASRAAQAIVDGLTNEN